MSRQSQQPNGLPDWAPPVPNYTKEISQDLPDYLSGYKRTGSIIITRWYDGPFDQLNLLKLPPQPSGKKGIEGFKVWLTDYAGKLDGLKGELQSILEHLLAYNNKDMVFLETCWAMLRERMGDKWLKQAVVTAPRFFEDTVKISSIFLSHPFSNQTVAHVLSWRGIGGLTATLKDAMWLPHNDPKRICMMEHIRYCYLHGGFSLERNMLSAMRKGGPTRQKTINDPDDFFDDFSWGESSAFSDLSEKEKNVFAYERWANANTSWIIFKWEKGFREFYTDLVAECVKHDADAIANDPLRQSAKESTEQFLIEKLTYYRSLFEKKEYKTPIDIYNTLTDLLRRVYLDRTTDQDRLEAAVLALEVKPRGNTAAKKIFQAARTDLENCIAAEKNDILKQKAQAVLDKVDDMHQTSADALSAALQELEEYLQAEDIEIFKRATQSMLDYIKRRQPDKEDAADIYKWAKEDFLKYIFEERDRIIKAALNIINNKPKEEARSQNENDIIRDARKIFKRESFEERAQIILDKVYWRIMPKQTNDNICRAELTRTLQATAKGLKAENRSVGGLLLQRHAKKIQGRSSLAWKILGGFLMTVGACLCVAGALIATATAIPTFGLGTVAGIKMASSGGAICLLGAGLFYRGRQKGLSKTLHQLGEPLAKASVSQNQEEAKKKSDEEAHPFINSNGPPSSLTATGSST